MPCVLELGRQIGCDRVTELGRSSSGSDAATGRSLYPSNKRFLQYYYKVLRSINLTEAEELAGLISDEGHSDDRATVPDFRRWPPADDAGGKALRNISALLGHVEANSEAKVDAGSLENILPTRRTRRHDQRCLFR